MRPIPPRPSRENFDPFSAEAAAANPNRYGREAYICAHDRRFAAFAAELVPDAAFDYLHHSEEFICAYCNVPALDGSQMGLSGTVGKPALRWIDTSPEAVERWKVLKAQFDVWLARNPQG